jgi:hypothetical protein
MMNSARRHRRRRDRHLPIRVGVKNSSVDPDHETACFSEFGGGGSMGIGMTSLILRDIRIGVRAGGGMLIGILFFLAVITVVPFGVGPDLNLLARIGPAILWIGALLASLLGLDRLFQADREDGSLDMMILRRHEHPLAVTVFAKCVAHWLTTGLPLVIVSPALGLLMNMEPAAILATTRRFWPARPPSPSSAPPARRSPSPCRAAVCSSR